jgi:hypothetical protein
MVNLFQDKTNFLKKYRLSIIVLFVLTGLLLYYIPNEKHSYLQTDIDEIEKKSHSILLWAETILLITLFVFGLRQFKKITDLLYLIFGLGCMALTLFFLFDSIFLSATFFINKLSKSKSSDKVYNVVYIDKENERLLLWDNSLRKSIQADQLLKLTDKQTINVKDTITVSFSKGLLGFNFDPKIRTTKQ